MLMKKIIWHENSPSPLPLPINFSNVRPLQEKWIKIKKKERFDATHL